MRLDKKIQPKADELKAKAEVTKAEVAEAAARERSEPDAPAEASGAPEQAEEDAPEPGSPEFVKAKMRAALDRKKAQAPGRGETGSGAAQKNHGVAGPVGPKRFQRKSGG